jgi:glycosyltransferase involved in cell wall biosynthesis
MAERTLLSIVVPTKNRPPSLRRLLESLQHQDYRPYEVIVVDDSSDASVSSLNGISVIRREVSGGTGPARNDGSGERVNFLGQRGDVARLLAADIHCQPNTGPKPFGITFIEALYAGLPVVTTSIGGAMEIVDGSCGMLVAPHDPAALAGALRALIEDGELRARLGEAGPARAATLCDPARQMARLAEILNQAGARFAKPPQRHLASA